MNRAIKLPALPWPAVVLAVQFLYKFVYYFNTPYFVENADISDMTVTLDKEAGTFSIS